MPASEYVINLLIEKSSYPKWHRKVDIIFLDLPVLDLDDNFVSDLSPYFPLIFLGRIQIFFTGATGYIGGTVLSTILAKYPDQYNVRALVRSQDAVEKLKEVDVTAVVGSLDDSEVLTKESAAADVVINTANADHMGAAKAIVAGLTSDNRKDRLLIHTSGTGVLTDGARGKFESTEVPYSDLDMKRIHSLPLFQPHKDVDNFIMDNSHKFRSIIVSPPTIHGIGSGLFNRLSQQIPSVLVRGFVKAGKAGNVGHGVNKWNYVNVLDLGDLYALLLDKGLAGEADYGRAGGWYFAESGIFRWGDITQAIANDLKERSLVTSNEVVEFTPEEVDTLLGTYAWWAIGGNSLCTADRSRALGWKPTRPDIFATLKEEIDATLKRKA